MTTEELEALLIYADHQTPDSIRAAAITAAKRLGAPIDAIDALITMQNEGEWNVSYAFMDDDEEWFHRMHGDLVAATMAEASNLIADIETVAAMAERQRIDVWMAWQEKVVAMLQDFVMEGEANRRGRDDQRK
jgi:hypothetical protein